MGEKNFKEILILVAGATPQIVTETIYALSQEESPVYPDEIYIITTTEGNRRLRETLIERNILGNLMGEYNLPKIELTEDSFIIVKDAEGREIDDIRDEKENEAIGNLVTSFIREKAKDAGVRLHCSLAGGRKTMSFYMGAALQLFGRPWDKLYHVLVTPEFESHREFFYKPKKDRLIECRMPDGTAKKLNTKDAEIQLAELPFIRLGSKVSLHGKDFRELVTEGQREIDTATIQPALTLKLSERMVHIGSTIVEIVPVQLMIYAAFLKQKTDRCKYPERQYCLDCTDCFLVLADLSSRHALEDMAKDYNRIYKGQPLRLEEFLNKWRPDGMGIETIRQNISKTNRTLKEQLSDETLLPYYQISTVKKYASSRYGVRAEKGKIRIDS